MQLDKFTLKSQEALQEAKGVTERHHRQQIDVEHLLLALLSQKEGTVVPILQKLGANVDLMVSQLNDELNRLPKVTGEGAGQVYLSSRLNEIFNVAWKEAETLMDEYLSTEHLLLAIADERRGSAYQILQNNGLYSEDWNTEGGNDADPALRRVEVRYIWCRFDYDGDGINELQYVIRIGNAIVYRKECEEIPVASISPIPLAHRHVGMSLADSVADLEDINGNLTRQAIDNLNLANTPRIAVSDRVNMADMLDVRVGGVIRVDGQPPQEFMPVVVPNFFQDAVQALSFFDSRRQNRTGINPYFQGTDANTLNKTASGISQLTNSAAQRVEMIARNFASGMRPWPASTVLSLGAVPVRLHQVAFAQG